jgi:hypothetical protein
MARSHCGHHGVDAIGATMTVGVGPADTDPTGTIGVDGVDVSSESDVPDEGLADGVG